MAATKVADSRTDSFSNGKYSQDEKIDTKSSRDTDHDDRGLDNLNYPPPWRYSIFFPGGYSPKTMMHFKKPKNMYRAINLFAGKHCLPSVTLLKITEKKKNIKNKWEFTRLKLRNTRNVAVQGGIVSVYYGGIFIGALVAGSLADRAGRITAVVFGCLWAFLGAILQTCAYNITWMCCARVIAGVGVEAIDCVIPVWSAEVSSHQARGAFLAIEFFINIGGLVLAFWIEYFAYLNPNKEMA
ncbi:MAG: hypothetical protein M1814_004375 [Vezdaea aestivalis]|nr:MAG: hypothetical protein M1814_004375 [Vezdaea aestivalis]